MLKPFVASLTIVLCAAALPADPGQDCAKGQDLARQIQACSDAITRNSNDWLSYLGRAQLHETLGRSWGNQDEYEKAALDFDQALRLVNTALGARPNSELEHLSEALRAHRDCDQSKDPPRRIEGCADLIRNWQDAPQGVAFAHVNRGAGYAKLKDYPRAFAEYDEAIALSPNYLNGYLYRANLNRFVGRFPNAAEDLRRAADLVEAITREQPDPQLNAFVKSLREEIVEVNAYGQVEERWVAYLKEIQADWDEKSSNWPSKPYDLYRNTRRLPLSVSGRPVARLTSNPTSIERGQSSTLEWSTDSATDIQIQPELGPVDPSGSRRVHPTQSTTYHLTAKGPDETVDVSTRIIVRVGPPLPHPADADLGGDDVEAVWRRSVHPIYFDYDSYEVREDQRATVQANLRFFLAHPALAILIDGHCDERGSEEYNLGLGDRRANALKEVLVELGIPGDRISTNTFGKERPICTEATEDCWQKNRRAEFSWKQ
jgi:peptidoglycan-associated lipoprotein